MTNSDKSSNATEQEPKKSSGYRTAKENERFYKDGIKRLRTEGLQDSSGALIAELLDIKPTKTLHSYARRWVKKYPEHDQAPKVVGRLLLTDASQEVVDHAAHYILALPVDKLGPLLHGVLTSTDAFVQTSRNEVRAVSDKSGME